MSSEDQLHNPYNQVVNCREIYTPYKWIKLIIVERLHILLCSKNSTTLLNSRFKLFSKCKLKDNFLLSNWRCHTLKIEQLYQSRLARSLMISPDNGNKDLVFHTLLSFQSTFSIKLFPVFLILPSYFLMDHHPGFCQVSWYALTLKDCLEAHNVLYKLCQILVSLQHETISSFFVYCLYITGGG